MQWPMFNKVERQARRLDDMMAHLGVPAIDVVRLDGGRSYARARRICLSCQLAQSCGQWLADTPEGSEGPGFCPNLSLIEAAGRRASRRSIS